MQKIHADNQMVTKMVYKVYKVYTGSMIHHGKKNSNNYYPNFRPMEVLINNLK